MLLKENFTLEHIQALRGDNKVDQILLERSVYALSLLEALAVVGMPFIFKGGTSLMLLLEKPRRLSTDIDIIVKPGTDVQHYLDEAAKIFPFQDVQQQIRKGINDIVKRHFKFSYDSPVNQRPFYILLDILYEENHYSTLTRSRISNAFLLTEEPYAEVTMPSVNCILGDKLTAFAPHTTGIKFGNDKELEIIKQMYDVATLADVYDNFGDVYQSYMSTAASEISFRGLSISAADALRDSIEAAACVAGRGSLFKTEYPLYLDGIRSIVNHIYSERFTAEKAVCPACKVIYMAACVLKNAEFQKVIDPSAFTKEDISKSRYAKLSSLRRFDIEAFAYLVQAIRLLQE